MAALRLLARLAQHFAGAKAQKALGPAAPEGDAPLGIDGYGFVPLRVPDDFDVFGHFHAVDERAPVHALHFGADVLARVLGSA